ncbi:hypothetical protein PG985_003825 [Apiospora marii]|uniref:uncharacterized protein n=1 Tax=Apiospora marii TaxID=335849 RepID=UPI003131D3DC
MSSRPQGDSTRHDSPHREITETSRPEDWYGNSHTVSRIQEVHARYLETMLLSLPSLVSTSQSATARVDAIEQPDTHSLPRLSTSQEQARAAMSDMLAEDATPQNAHATIDWDADINRVYEHLDALFFRGLLKRSGRVRLHARPNGLDVNSRGNLHFGVTRYSQDGGQVDIYFDTQESGVAGVETRLQKRSRVLGIICHELVHAFLDVYGCHCRAVCNTREGGEWKLLVDDNMHSDAWTAIATRVNRVLVKFRDRLEYVLGRQWFFPVRVEGREDPELLADALSIDDTIDEDTRMDMQFYKTDDPIQARAWAAE